MYSGHNTFVRPTNLSTGKPMFIFADRKGGFPHSEITGSKGARASPVLIAACHVLHRLSMPRHPSEALMRLIVLSKTHDRIQDLSIFVQSCALICQTMMSSKVCPRSAGRRRTDPSFTMSITDPQKRSCEFDILDRASSSSVRREDGGARRDRTDDLMLAKHALYQLSYGPI
jgi:hypothetical protein